MAPSGIVEGMSDATARVTVGDELISEPFESLYLREFSPLIRLAMTLVDSREIAEEVVQDAFARLYLRYSAVHSPVGYVRVSVLNGARGVLRRRRLMRRRATEREEADSLRVNHVIDAVRRLPKKQCDMVLLRYELQLTDSEIAETLDVPIGTVKSTIHRALARLRDEVIP